MQFEIYDLCQLRILYADERCTSNIKNRRNRTIESLFCSISIF